MPEEGRVRRAWRLRKVKAAVVAVAVLGTGGGIAVTDSCGCATPVFPDTTPPTVSVAAPTAGATVSGTTVSVTATAADDRGVSGVQFKLDGVNLQAEDTTNPYAITWDTTTTTDANHTLTAVARDAAANSTTSTAVTVIVSQPGIPSGTANEWVNTTAGASPIRCATLATCGTYDSTHAYGSFQTAVTAASAGDTIRVKCGSYPVQTIATGTKATFITVEAETHDSPTSWLGALTMTTCVTVVRLNINIDKVHVVGIEATPTPWTTRGDGATPEFQDVQNCTGNPCTGPDAGALYICVNVGTTCNGYTDILIDYWKGPGGQFQASGITIDHSNFGGYDYCYLGSAQSYRHVAALPNGNAEQPFLNGDTLHFPWPAGSGALSNMTIRNTVFHDAYHGLSDSEGISCAGFGSSNGVHADFMQGNGGSNITIERNAFWTGGDKPIQWTVFNGVTAMTGILVQNNYFGLGFNTTVVLGQTLPDCSGIIFQNNLGPTWPNVSGGCTVNSGPIVRNNIIYAGVNTCVPGTGNLAFYSHNVTGAASTQTCGTGANISKKCNPTWVSLDTTFNLHRTAAPDPTLAASDTCANNFSDAAFPAADWLGTARPLGAGADAGPSEVP